MEKTQRILEVDFIIDCRNGKKHAYDIVIGQWQMIRFIIIYLIIWMGALQENSFGYWQNLSTQRIRLTSAQKKR